MVVARICFTFLVLLGLIHGCSLMDEGASKKPATSGFTATPASYYSTAKAKYLGTKYKDNLDRIVERIVRSPKTASLQFANNISSVGGIGFFTHSATKTPDERYLEVVLATPETFETKGEYSEKIHQLFSRYGFDLLSNLSGDSEIYQDGELSGYGLNLAWRTVVTEPGGSRVGMARAIIYFPKDKVRSFLREEIKQNDLLRDAVIFGEEENGPLALVSYQPQNPRPDFRPAIREDNLASLSTETTSARTTTAPSPSKELAGKINQKAESEKKEIAAKEIEPHLAAKPSPLDTKAEVKATPPAARKNSPTNSPANGISSSSGEKGVPPGDNIGAEKFAQDAAAETARPVAPVAELKPEPPLPEPQVSPAPVALAPAPIVAEKPVEVPSANPLPVALPSIVETPAKSPPAPENDKAERPLPDEIKLASPKPSAETKRNEADQKPITEPQNAAALAMPSKPVANSSAAKRAVEIKVPEIAVAPTLVAKLPEAIPAIKEQPPAPVAEAIRLEKNLPETKSAPPAPTSSKRQQEIPVKPSESNAVPALEQKASQSLRTTEDKAPAPLKATAAVEVRPIVTAKTEAPKEKKPETKPLEPSAAAKTTPAPFVQAALPAVAPSPVKSEPAVVAPVPATTATPVEQKTIEKPIGEQLALVRKNPIEMVPENKALIQPRPKALEGFIIQLAFQDKDKAQHWAENMQRRGYAVSITEAGMDGALRVRLGNFALRDDAERQLRSFKQDGINGIIINLPQAFRPEARSSMP
jgi:DedD protein